MIIGHLRNGIRLRNDIVITIIAKWAYLAWQQPMHDQ